MKPPGKGSGRTRFAVGLAVAAIGLAHSVVPELFDPINQLAFPAGTRLHTYINGGAETAIGLTLMAPRTRPAFVVLYVGYPVYLLANLIRANLLG